MDSKPLPDAKWSLVRWHMLAKLAGYGARVLGRPCDPVADQVWAVYACGCGRLRAGFCSVSPSSRCQDCEQGIERRGGLLTYGEARRKANDRSRVAGISIPHQFALDGPERQWCVERLEHELDAAHGVS